MAPAPTAEMAASAASGAASATSPSAEQQQQQQQQHQPAASTSTATRTSPVTTTAAASPSSAADSTFILQGFLLSPRARAGFVSVAASASASSIATSEERFAMLVAPTHVNDVQDVFMELLETPVADIVMPGTPAASSATTRRGGAADGEAMLRCLGHITKAAVQGKCSPLLVLTAANPASFEYIHLTDITGILDEVDLRQPCHFVLQTGKGSKDYRFHVKTSYEYTDWIAALRACVRVGVEVRKEMVATRGPKQAAASAAKGRALGLWKGTLGTGQPVAAAASAVTSAQVEEPTQSGQTQTVERNAHWNAGVLSGPDDSDETASPGSTPHSIRSPAVGASNLAEPKPTSPPSRTDSYNERSRSTTPMESPMFVPLSLVSGHASGNRPGHPAGSLYPSHGSDVQMKDISSLSSLSQHGDTSTEASPMPQSGQILMSVAENPAFIDFLSSSRTLTSRTDVTITGPPQEAPPESEEVAASTNKTPLAPTTTTESVVTATLEAPMSPGTASSLVVTSPTAAGPSSTKVTSPAAKRLSQISIASSTPSRRRESVVGSATPAAASATSSNTAAAASTAATPSNPSLFQSFFRRLSTISSSGSLSVGSGTAAAAAAEPQNSSHPPAIPESPEEEEEDGVTTPVRAKPAAALQSRSPSRASAVSVESRTSTVAAVNASRSVAASPIPPVPVLSMAAGRSASMAER
ncbi:hypothetical protein DFJ73DRAFT_943661 [Zopfochytrium polystomum]|nr:hypothetical protein DFJ73DRAFT_943661 [Zopfochytrium polystomum]